jgi:tetratricopeptide (TPR) repeat protein
MGDSTTQRPTPSANGTIGKTPFLHLLVYALDKKLAGSLELFAPDRRSAAILFVEGRPAKVRTSEPVAHLGRVLLDLGHIAEDALNRSLAELAKAKAAGPALHGGLLLSQGLIDAAQLRAGLREQLTRKLRYVAAMSADTTYAYYDAFDALHGWGGEGEGIDPVPLLWGMLLEYAPWEHVRAALARVSSSPLRLVRGRGLERLRLKKEEVAAAELLGVRPMCAADLAKAGHLNDRTAQLLAYLLLVTKQVDVLPPRESAPPPAEAASAPVVSAPPAGAPLASPPAASATAASARAVSAPPVNATSAGMRAASVPVGSAAGASAAAPNSAANAPASNARANATAATGPRVSVPAASAAATGAPAANATFATAPATAPPAASVAPAATRRVRTTTPMPGKAQSTTPVPGPTGANSAPIPAAARSTASGRHQFGLTPPRQPPLPPDLAERWHEIVDRAETIDRADYFMMLDLPRDATHEEIEAAFFALAKRWHPDRLPAELAPVRVACSRVFARMSEAHGTLTNDEQRAQYMRLLADGSGSPEMQATVAKVVDAAQSFQKAEVCLRRNDLGQAETFCRKALEDDATQPDYLAMLAWLVALKPENHALERTVESIHMLDRAVGMSDRCEKAFFWRGMLYKRMGRNDLAVKDFRRAAELNDRNIDAAREVRLYYMRGGRRSSKPPAMAKRSTPSPPKPDETAKPGILGRFFKK